MNPTKDDLMAAECADAFKPLADVARKILDGACCREAAKRERTLVCMELADAIDAVGTDQDIPRETRVWVVTLIKLLIDGISANSPKQ